jgi:hypothetical protein
MPTAEIEEFGRLLIEVRDAAIKSSDAMLQRGAKDPVAKRWRKTMDNTTPYTDLAKTIIPDIVDETLARLLLAIDQQLLPLSFTATTGKTVSLTSEGLGELCGGYLGGDWRQRYSRERFIDDFSDS